ncbi:MAG: short-chain dehydrogenase/reductase [Amycolatopsis sp.]|nr:short-chain dehydrogenase/reductase [Amycolatopsis sp.]
MSKSATSRTLFRRTSSVRADQQARAPHLIERGGGAIVNTSSGASWVGEPVPARLRRVEGRYQRAHPAIASAYGKDGIRANVVSPGAVLSETAIRNTSEEFQARMLTACTLERLGKPEDLANTICFLLSDDADWVSGQVWSVNGGAGFRD